MEARKVDSTTIELHSNFDSNNHYDLLVEMSVPKSIDLSSGFDVRDFYKKNISSKRRFHKGKNMGLMLLYIKILHKKGLTDEEFRTSMSLFVHLLLREIQSLSYKEDSSDDEFMAKVESLEKLIGDFRDFSFEDERKHLLFCKLDSLISFEFEQRLLYHCIGFNKEDNPVKQKMNELIKNESNYRKINHFETWMFVDEDNVSNKDKVSRIISHFDIQKKLIELPFALNSTSKSGETFEKYVSIALSTAAIMLVFGFIMFQLKLLGLDANVQFITAFAGIYVIRDIFKESIKTWVLKKITKNKPIDSETIKIPSTKEEIGKSKTWINLDESSSNSGQKEASTIILKKDVQIQEIDFHGLKQVREIVSIDLSQILRLFPYGKKDFYFNNSQRNVQKIATSRRGKIDIKAVIKKKNGKQTETETFNYKITFEKGAIVKCETRL